MKKIMLFCLLVGFAAATMAQGQFEASKSSKCGSQDCQTVMKLKKEFLEKNFTLKEEQKKPFWDAFDAYAKAEYAAFQKKVDRQKQRKKAEFEQKQKDFAAMYEKQEADYKRAMEAIDAIRVARAIEHMVWANGLGKDNSNDINKE